MFLPEELILKLANFLNTYVDLFYSKSFSQEGEDIVLKCLFQDKEFGFYVDVGAHHPKRFSNTYFFYKQGWSGINIEACPGSCKIFDRLRPRDINLELAISDKKESLKYYIFNEPALNTFDHDLAIQRNVGKYKLLSTQNIFTKTLGEVLDIYLPTNQKIDFFTIDVEGFDLKVLKSNNWQKYRPEVLVCESRISEIVDIRNDDIFCFLDSQGYALKSKILNSLIFKRRI